MTTIVRVPTEQTMSLVERLRNRDQHDAAHHLEREACETNLTAIEAIDPVTQTMIEELRLEVEKRLRLSDNSKDKR